MKKKEYGVYVYDADGYEMELARHTDQAVLEALVEHLEELVDPETIEAYIFPVDSPATDTSAGANPLAARG